MNKYIKLGTVSVLILSGFIIYFIKQSSDREYLQNSIQCQEIGNKLYKEDNLTREPSNVYDPKFYFIKKTKTCLYSGGYTSITPDYKTIIYYTIKDVYRNTTIARGGNSELVDDLERQKYNELYQKYFK